MTDRIDPCPSDGVEDPLDDRGSLVQQMEQISVICRCEYQLTCTLLMQLFDSELATSPGKTPDPRRLTWLVLVMGAAVGGRVAFSTSDQHDLIDGDLICRVLRLMEASDQRLPNENGNAKLEFAFLWHLEQFRKIYISDQVQKTSKVYNKLSQMLGLNDESAVLAIFVRKMCVLNIQLIPIDFPTLRITNLKYWSTDEKLIDETLTLLNDLSVGYSSVRKLVRLREIQFLMDNHTNEHFTFLSSSIDLKTMKSRTTFYSALTRLLCVNLDDDDEVFHRFMAPLTAAESELAKVFQLADSSAFIDQTQVKRTVIGLVRDVRGVAIACNTKNSYSLLFDWLYPDMFSILEKSLECWFSDPEVTTPVLKLVHELCQNRSQRLQFEMSSPNAILLFQQASKMICTYGSRILTLPENSKEEPYKSRFKGLGICFGILKVTLNGSYLHFGIFRLYGDSCLNDALSMFIKMLLIIPQNHLLNYPKLSLNYYYLLESLTQDHLPFFSNLESAIFVIILQSLNDGLSALDTAVCTSCCNSLDLLISYLYKRVSRGGKPRTRALMQPEGDHCLRTLEQTPNIFSQMLSTLLSTVMFDDSRTQWSMSRPLLGFILLQENVFSQIQTQILTSHPQNKHDGLNQCFVALMDGVERNLSLRNKDRFTQVFTNGGSDKQCLYCTVLCSAILCCVQS